VHDANREQEPNQQPKQAAQPAGQREREQAGRRDAERAAGVRERRFDDPELAGHRRAPALLLLATPS